MTTKRKNKGLPNAAKRPPSPREAAFECIEAVVYDAAYANLAMPRILANAGLSGRDAGFATELAYGALRMEKLYDAVIASAARRPAEAVDNLVRIALWLGIHQALAMRVPAHAAVNETVEQARRHESAEIAGRAGHEHRHQVSFESRSINSTVPFRIHHSGWAATPIQRENQR